MKKVVILDYGLGNLFSVHQACREVGMNAYISEKPEDLSSADGIILPGVGAFGHAMDELKKRALVEPLLKFVARGKPLLGICLGMQLLLESSEEFGLHQGLGLIKGRVVRFPSEVKGKSLRVPHMGWSSIYTEKATHPALRNVANEADVYFVHSYFARPEHIQYQLTWSEYGGQQFTSSIVKDNLWAFQFHPEKSGPVGLQLYRNWAENFGLGV